MVVSSAQNERVESTHSLQSVIQRAAPVPMSGGSVEEIDHQEDESAFADQAEEVDL
jgi:hypothetical protein